MLKKSNLLSLLLAIVLLTGLVAGCSTKDGNATPTPSVAPSAADPTPLPSESDQPDETDVYTLPLVDEVKEFSVFMSSTGVVTGNMIDFSDNTAYKKVEEMTNVRLKFQHPSTVGEQEALNLMIASDELPDMIVVYDEGFFSGGLAKYARDNYIHDLTGYIPEYAPHYQQMRLDDSDVFKCTMDDTGHMYAFKSIANQMGTAFIGLVARQDWLDDLGISKTPETYDEWHTMLTGMKGLASGDPLYLAQNGVSNYLTSGFFTDNNFLNIGGKVTFGPTTAEFKDYVALMAQWYSEGLIDKDFPSRQAMYLDWGQFAEGKWGVMPIVYTFIDTMELISPDENFSLSPLRNPKVNASDTILINSNMSGTSRVSSQTGVITTKCSDVELACRYFDFFFTEEGSLVANYGVENETFEYVDGRPQFTEFVYNNPDYSSFSDAMMTHAYGTAWPIYFLSEREAIGSSEKALSFSGYWTESFDAEKSYTLKTFLSLTDEESSRFSATYTDIETYVTESIPQFITGNRSMDAWDSFLGQIESMGVEECVGIYQAASDRFETRGQ